MAELAEGITLYSIVLYSPNCQDPIRLYPAGVSIEALLPVRIAESYAANLQSAAFHALTSYFDKAHIMV